MRFRLDVFDTVAASSEIRSAGPYGDSAARLVSATAAMLIEHDGEKLVVQPVVVVTVANPDLSADVVA